MKATEPPFFKTVWNHDRNLESDRTGTYCPEETLAQQHTKDEADINTIVRNFGITGKLPDAPLPPSYHDFEETFDFQTALNTIAAAKASFMMLPAEVRDAFHNDPHRFVAQVELMRDEPNQEQRAQYMRQLRAMGLAVQAEPIDKTTLGDVLRAIKEQGAPPAALQTPTPVKGS